MTDYIILDQKVYYLARIIRTPLEAVQSGSIFDGDRYFMLLYEVAERLSVDALGAYYIERVDIGSNLPLRFLEILPTSKISSAWSVCVGTRVFLVPKF